MRRRRVRIERNPVNRKKIIWDRLKDGAGKAKNGFRGLLRKSAAIIDRRPLISFFSLLGLLVLLIVGSNILRRPQEEKKAKPVPDVVDIYRIGTVPKMTLQAQIEKSGVIQVTSLMGGVVTNIYITEGKTVGRGQWLISLGTNYQGGNALSLSRQIAEKQFKNLEDTLPAQKELISKQRDVANQTETNADKLRDITNQSIGDTQNLINLNNDIISTLDQTINTLTASGSTTSASLILSSKQMKSQFQSANLQLNSSLRSAQYQVDENNPPTQLANLQKDITLKQLEIQEKALDLSKEVSRLQLQLARVNEAMMYPAAPFTAVVEKVFVRVGQNITPGTPIAILTVAKEDPKFIATVYTSKEIAQNISQVEPSVINIGSKTENLYPTFISTEPIQGNLFSVVYTLPQEDYDLVGDKSFVSVQIPIGYADTSPSVPYLPIDSIYQTQDASYVFVAEGGKAVSRKVELGGVYGCFVMINSGIRSGDAVILNRNVVAGDEVEGK